MKISIAEAPATEAVELEALKADLDLGHPGEDTLLSCLLTAARIVCNVLGLMARQD